MSRDTDTAYSHCMFASSVVRRPSSVVSQCHELYELLRVPSDARSLSEPDGDVGGSGVFCSVVVFVAVVVSSPLVGLCAQVFLSVSVSVLPRVIRLLPCSPRAGGARNLTAKVRTTAAACARTHSLCLASPGAARRGGASSTWLNSMATDAADR